MKITAVAYVTFHVVVFTLLGACSDAPDSEELAATDPGGAPTGRLDAAVVPERYRLELRIDPREDRFVGNTAIDVNLGQSTNHVWLHGKNLDVTEAFLVDAAGNRVDAQYEQRDDTGVALVTLAEAVPAGTATLHFAYSAPFNTSNNALFKVVRDDEAYVASQLQPIAARQIFPGFDEPAFKTTFDVTLETRPGDVAVTNTPEESAETREDGFVSRRFATSRPMPTYLLAFAVGPYDVVDYGVIPPNTIRDREVPLRGIAARGQAERLEYALKHTDGLLTVLEEYFGTPYPYRKLDLIAVPESFGGAMENIGAIIYDEYLLLMDDASPIEQRRAYTSVHAHEIAHMWFGNLVTPNWWNDIWLNESFATWMMYKAADGYWPDGEFDRNTLKAALGAMRSDSLAAARQIREPVDHSSEIINAFDAITYRKGGGVLAMLERYVGEEDFRKGVRLHMSRHEDGTATAEEFIESLAEGSDRAEIEAAFTSFVEQTGVPLLSVSLDCTTSDRPTLTVAQQRYAPLGSRIDRDAAQWRVPMCIRYGAGGSDASTCALLAEKTQSIVLEGDSCPAWVHPNADGAGYYRFSLDDAGWQSLTANVSSLTAGEALVLADSLDAAMRAGEVSAQNYVDGMTALLAHDAWDVANAVTEHLEALTGVIEEPKLGPVRAAFSRLARPVFETIDPSGGSGAELLYDSLQRFLIVAARDPELRAPLVDKAAARIGLDREPNPDAVSPGELETVLSVGVQDLGKPFFDRLMAMARDSDDPAFRNSATGALARVEDPDLVARLQESILNGDFKGIEALQMVYRQIVRGATTELTYEWIRDNDDAIIALIPEPFRPNVFPSFGQAFCTRDRADEWQALVESHADDLPGYERNLAQAIESVMLCAALRESSQDDLVSAFAGLVAGDSPVR